MSNFQLFTKEEEMIWPCAARTSGKPRLLCKTTTTTTRIKLFLQSIRLEQSAVFEYLHYWHLEVNELKHDVFMKM